MTTTFKLTSTTVFQPRNLDRTAESAAASTNRPATPAPRPDNSVRTDTATLSASAINATPEATSDPIRAARIDSIRQSIAAGTYSVPAHDVASAIIDSLL